MMNRIDEIINESIENVINEGFGKDFKSFFSKIYGSYLKKINGLKPKHKKDKEKPNFKIRKLSYGRESVYDYDDYKRKHREVSKSDMNSLRDMIDQEKTDIAAVAREVFPDHTNEGAQSQLRKILNGEREMTKDVFIKLNGMIASGQIAIKK